MPGKVDIRAQVDVDQSILKAAKTASENGASFEIADYNGIGVIIDAGAWTDGTHTFTVQESDDNSAWSAVADTDLYGDSEPVIDGTADDDQKYRIGYKGNKRYLRVITVVSGTTTGAIYGALIVKGAKSEGLLS